MVYSFADFKIEYVSKYSKVEKYCSDYICDGKPDVTFEPFSDEYIVESNKNSTSVDTSLPRLEIFAFHHKIAEWAPSHGAFVFHAALIDVGGTGIAFTARSGTGKSTHMMLWQKLLGDRMTVVNGDKPLVRFFDGEKYAFGYGSPWNGKEGLATKMRTPLKHICLIERAEENSCVPISKEEVFDFIFDQVFLPKNPVEMMATLSLLNRMIDSVKLWKIKCNMDISAAKTAYEAIFNEGENKNEA